jgi:hypothetical protein
MMVAFVALLVLGFIVAKYVGEYLARREVMAEKSGSSD